ncbi:MAG TPA: Holliday junction resolvase-like protein, partial [Candidatus Angelobacter sp.]|nr:Holliday junction resolvase-like protein [Candidatus Angelobacter sp.]
LRLFQNQKTELVNSIRQATQQEDQQRFSAQLPQIIKQQRDDAVSKQRDVVKGKITEQLAPLLPLFQKICPNFAEARFLGSPIDYVIFRNLHKTESNEPLEIILLDIKTGNAQLNHPEKRIKNAVEEGRVKFYRLPINVESEREPDPQMVDRTVSQSSDETLRT